MCQAAFHRRHPTGFSTQGLALLVIEGSPNRAPGELISLIGNDLSFGFLSVSMLALAAVVAIALLVRAMSSHLAASLSLPCRRALAYTVAGGGYGLTGVLLAGQLGVADPWSGGHSCCSVNLGVDHTGADRIDPDSFVGNLLGKSQSKPVDGAF